MKIYIAEIAINDVEEPHAPHTYRAFFTRELAERVCADVHRNHPRRWRLLLTLPIEDANPVDDPTARALDIALQCGGIDGDHHKAWVIDQMVRVLTGPAYDEWVRKACDGEEGPETYGWDEGIAP